LEQRIADKTVTDDYVGLAAKQPVTLDKTTVVEVDRLLQQHSGSLDLLIAFDCFDAHVKQCHSRLRNAQTLRRNRTHHTELIKLFGGAIHIGTQVEQQAGTLS